MQSTILPDIEHLNALVVGATQGIGLGFVRALLEDTRIQKIFCTYRSQSTTAALSTLKEDHGDRLVLLQMDVTDESQIAAAVETMKEIVPQLHISLYCVGVLHEGEIFPEKSLRDLNAEKLLYSFHVNSIGAAVVAKHLASLLKRNTSSIFAAVSAKVGSIEDNRLGGWYGYRASKAALNMFMRTTAIEFSRRCPNTIVVALHPGTTDTRLSEPFQNNVPPAQLFPVEHTVNLLLGVMAKLELKDSGEFYSWNGSRLPW